MHFVHARSAKISSSFFLEPPRGEGEVANVGICIALSRQIANRPDLLGHVSPVSDLINKLGLQAAGKHVYHLSKTDSYLPLAAATVIEHIIAFIGCMRMASTWQWHRLAAPIRLASLVPSAGDFN